MINFITGFEHYATMNSWNGSYGYSYNVKIHSLPFTSKQKDVLYEMLDTQEFFDNINYVVRDWDEEMVKHGSHTEKKEMRVDIKDLSQKKIKDLIKNYEERGWNYDRHGTAIAVFWKNKEISDFTAGFNGRSEGHLVLYKWNGHNNCGTSWVHSEEELEEMTVSEVKFVYDVLIDFQKLYKTLIEECKYLADNNVVEDEEYSVIKTRKVLKSK